MMKTNIVRKEALRKVQIDTFQTLRNALICSYGPNGSYSNIDRTTAFNNYSKDGHTILSSIQFMGRIESAIKEDLENLTRHIVKEVGDGTTAGVILSSLIFEELCKDETEHDSAKVIRDFKTAVSKIVEEIKTHSKEFTAEDAYDIAMISTNGDEEIAGNIKAIYEEYGKDVYIDVAASNTPENLIKIYDGLNVEAGYSDSCYINQPNGVCAIRNPRVYVFEDPVDTPEMVNFFNVILNDNIIRHLEANSTNFTPTVILAPKVTKDISSFMDSFNNYMYKYPADQISNRPPFLLVADIHEAGKFMDLARLANAKPIKKYLDPKLQERDIELGLAPTLENIHEFAGFCDLVEADSVKTKFVNPQGMKDEDGKDSMILQAMIKDLEAELARAYEENADANVTGTLKRRINSLKANMVEYLVGGVSVADRDAVRDLVEDAVLNCRSAAANGVGYGSNFELARAAHKVARETSSSKVTDGNFEVKTVEFEDTKYSLVIAEAADKLRAILYGLNNDGYLDHFNKELENDVPKNIRTGEFDGKVKSSIKSDIVILETISKIITLVYTCNQFILPSPAVNVYDTLD